MNSLYGDFRNITFDNIYNNVDAFVNGDDEQIGWKTSPYFESGLISDNDINKIYYLLYANYGNSSIASNDVNRFTFKLMSIVYQYGPIWAKKTEVQKRIRNLSEDELREGTKAIYNQAQNPSTIPSTDTLSELLYINAQNTTGYKKSKAEAYASLWGLLVVDPTKEFMEKFKSLFLTVVYPEKQLLYEEETN